jgi:hypothetical protein
MASSPGPTEEQLRFQPASICAQAGLRVPGFGGTAARSRESIRPTTRIAFECGGDVGRIQKRESDPFRLESKNPGCIRGFCAFNEQYLTDET